MDNKAVNEYIDELKVYLHQLEKSDQDEVLEFYREYLIDAKIDNKDAIINELGTPKRLARKVLADYSIKMSEDNYKNVDDGHISNNDRFKKNLMMIGLIILALMATPVAIPVAIVLVICLVLFFGLGIFFILLFLFLLALSVILGVGAIFIGISVIFQSFGTALFYMGVGLMILGVNFFIIPFVIAMLRWVFDLIVMFFRWLGKKLLYGRKTPVKGGKN
jgi:Predicted membrane protein